MILATVVLIIGMMYMSVQAAEDSRQRAAAGRGEGRAAQTPAPQVTAGPELTDDELLDLLGSSPVSPGAGTTGGGGQGPAPAPGPGGGRPGPDRPRATPTPAQDDPSVNPAAQVTQPRPGRYTYTSGEGDDYNLQMDSAGGGRFTETIQMGSGDFSGSIAQEVVWGSDTKTLDKLTFTFGGQSSTCDFQPDITIYRMPLSRGLNWQTTGSCQSPDPTDPTTTYDVTYEASSRVVGAQRLSIGGQDVEAWIIETTGKTTSTGGGDTDEDEFFSRDFLSPAHGISVRVYSQGGFSPGGGEYTVSSVNPQ